jgi:hypothetical protein
VFAPSGGRGVEMAKLGVADLKVSLRWAARGYFPQPTSCRPAQARQIRCASAKVLSAKLLHGAVRLCVYPHGQAA